MTSLVEITEYRRIYTKLVSGTPQFCDRRWDSCEMRSLGPQFCLRLQDGFEVFAIAAGRREYVSVGHDDLKLAIVCRVQFFDLIELYDRRAPDPDEVMRVEFLFDRGHCLSMDKLAGGRM